MVNIGERIGELRKRAGYTQKELAEKLNVTVQMVSKWETGATAPDVYMVSEIADAFGVSTDAVIGHGTESGYGADKVYEELKEIFISRIAYTNEAFEKYGWTPEAKRERAADVVKAMHENPLSAVGSINPEKLFYGSEDTGFVMMDDKDKTLFPEKSDALFDFLGNKTNRLILNFIHEHIYSGPISNVYIAESLGITTEEADVCLDFLKNNYMLTEKKALLGAGKELTVYYMRKIMFSRNFAMLRAIASFGRKINGEEACFHVLWEAGFYGNNNR